MNWNKVKLGDVAEVVTKGTTPTTLGHSFESDGIPFLRVQNIQDGQVDLNGALFIDKKTDQVLKRSRIQPNDLLISIAGTIGRCALVSSDAKPMNCNQAVAIVRIETEDVNRRFLLRWLETDAAKRKMAGAQVTGTISNLSLTQVSNLEIPLPPLAEQQRLAAILDEADALRALRRDGVAALDELAQSLFLELFGDPAMNPKNWEMVEFSQAIRDETARTPKIQTSEFSITGQFPIVDQGQEDIAGFHDDESLLTSSRLPVVIFGDHTRIVKLIHHPFTLGADGTKVLCPQEGFDATFLAYFLKSAKIPNLGYSRHMKEVKRLRYFLPPLALQQEFAEQIGQLETLGARARAQAVELDALFAALSARAFAGELSSGRH